MDGIVDSLLLVALTLLSGSSPVVANTSCGERHLSVDVGQIKIAPVYADKVAALLKLRLLNASGSEIFIAIIGRSV